MRTAASPVTIQLGNRQLPWWLRYLPSRIQFLDDFEGVLKWYQSLGTVTRESVFDVFEGNYCLKLATAAAAGSEATAYLFLSATQPSKIMTQLRWHYKAGATTTPRFFALRMDFFDGAFRTSLGLRHLANLTTPQDKWQYLDSTNSWVDLPGAAQRLLPTQKGYQYLMVKADLARSPPRYIQAELNNLIIDMSAYDMYKVSITAVPRVDLALSVLTDAAAVTEAYVDAFCFSDQEP